jgi:nicotinamidase-related amidase
MGMTDRLKLGAAALVVASSFLSFGGPARAQTIVDQWTSVKAPPAPVLKSVTVDPKTTAFLVLDIVKQICKGPPCLATVPKIKAFLAQARAHKMPVIYSEVPVATKADINPAVAPIGSEPIVSSHANKFTGTDLEKILKDRHITTIIPVGTSAQGAVLFTGSQAAFLGFKVIVPVDGMSAPSLYAEQAAAWVLANAPGVGQNTTLTRFDMIGW